MQNNEKPLVSVVIPCYNHEMFVQDCIQSVIDQTYENIELIIIDDGSKDNSVHKIQEMIPLCEERFVRFEFRFRPNKGLSATLNEALEWCQGEYFSTLASDDKIKKDKIYTQTKYISNESKCAGVFGGIEIIGEKNNKIRLLKFKKYTFEDIFLHNHELPAPTQLLRTSIIKDVGGFINGLIIEDWYMWLKITEKGYTLDYIPDIFSCYRYHIDNTSKKYDLILNERLKILNFFPNEKKINLAIGNAYLVAANDLVSIDKKGSLKYFFKYIFCDSGLSRLIKLLCKFRSIKYLIKFIVV